jgi:hypothetical protein
MQKYVAMLRMYKLVENINFQVKVYNFKNMVGVVKCIPFGPPMMFSHSMD